MWILGISSAAATKTIARLEWKGSVERSIDMMNPRCINVRMTYAGTDVLHQAMRMP